MINRFGCLENREKVNDVKVQGGRMETYIQYNACVDKNIEYDVFVAQREDNVLIGIFIFMGLVVLWAIYSFWKIETKYRGSIKEIGPIEPPLNKNNFTP